MGRQFTDYTFKIMGKVLIIKGANFSGNAVANVLQSTIVIKTSVTPAGGGTISGAGSYASGTSVTLTATANSGYVFSKWSDGVTTPSRTVIVKSGLPTFIAEFNAEAGIVTVPSVVVDLHTDINKIYINNKGYGITTRAAILTNNKSVMLSDTTKVEIANNSATGIDVSNVGVYTITNKNSMTLHVDVEKAKAKNASRWSFGAVDLDTMTLVNTWQWYTKDVTITGLNPSKTYAIIGNFGTANDGIALSQLIHGTDFTIS